MKICIIGNGISGITAARFLRKNSNHDITVISAETEYFYSRTALMYIYMGHMRFEDTKPYEDSFWEKNRISLVMDRITKVDFQQKQLLGQKNTYEYDKLIIATGSSINKYNWPGQNLKGVGGLYSLQDLEYIEKYSEDLERAVIVGGGLIGIEMAEMFHSRHIPVTFLVREGSYWSNVLPAEESKMVLNHILKHGIDLRIHHELKEILGDDHGRCKAVITTKGERIDCNFVGLTAGVSPNIDFLKETELHIEKGIVVDEYLATNIEGVYAIGDCAQIAKPIRGRRPIEAIWYTGRKMGETVAYNLLGKQIRYQPRLWFNSAKFIDMEYQVYGDVLANPPETHSSIIWIHAEKEKSIRIVYDKDQRTVLGFNLLGIRFRHEVCEKWILEKTPLEKVLTQLKLADFDPEFYSSYAPYLIEQYNAANDTELKLEKKSSWNQVFSFLKNKK